MTSRGESKLKLYCECGGHCFIVFEALLTLFIQIVSIEVVYI